MNILSAIYSGNKGILKGLEKVNESSLAQIEAPGSELALRATLDKTQVQASAKVVKISDNLLRELTKVSDS